MEDAGAMFDGLDEFRDDLDEELLADHLADADICELAGVERIEDVRSLALVVKTTDGTSVLGDLGNRVPQLTSLKLSGSSIASIRDLGTNWPHLDVLWLARCGLNDVDGLHGLHMIRELYLAFNDIVDLSGFVALEQLNVLDLEANKVADIGQVEFLTCCSELTELTLQHNPAAQAAHYRRTVCSRLPQVCALDDEVVTAADREPVSEAAGSGAAAGPAHSSRDTSRPGTAAEVAGGGAGMQAEDPMAQVRRELQLVMDGVKYAQIEGLAAGLGSASSPMHRPSTALGSRPNTASGSFGGRPLTSSSGGTLSRPRTSWRAPAGFGAFERGDSVPLRKEGGGASSHPSSPAARQLVSSAGSAGSNTRPGTAMRLPTSARPGTAGRLGSGRPPMPTLKATRPALAQLEDASSALTIGTQNIFCGTGIRALRAHKLRPDADEEGADQPALRGEPLPHQRASLSRGSSVHSVGSSTRRPSAELIAISPEAVEKHAWSREYAEMLQQLKAVKLEEAWEGRDSFADMEMGLEPLDLDLEDEPQPPSVDGGSAPTSVPNSIRRARPGCTIGPASVGSSRGSSPVRPSRRPGRTVGRSSSGGVDILTLDDGAGAKQQEWQVGPPSALVSELAS